MSVEEYLALTDAALGQTATVHGMLLAEMIRTQTPPEIWPQFKDRSTWYQSFYDDWGEAIGDTILDIMGRGILPPLFILPEQEKREPDLA